MSAAESQIESLRCTQFVALCRRLNLFTQAIVAIDGSKFKAVNNRDKNFTRAKVQKRIEQVEASIVRYLDALDRTDKEDSDVAEAPSLEYRHPFLGGKAGIFDVVFNSRFERGPIRL